MGNSSSVVVARARRLRDDAQRRTLPHRTAEIIPPGAILVEDSTTCQLGQSNSGAPVLRAMWRVAGREARPVAVVFLQEVLDAQDFLAEASTLCTLSHPNVQDCLGYFVERPRFGLALEYLPLGTLASQLWDANHVARVKLHWHSVTKINIDIAAGLSYLHSEHLVHGNLHAKSVLIKYVHNGDFQVKLSDFQGGPRRPNQISTSSVLFIKGLPPHQAPEYITADADRHTSKVDSYAFGMLLYELATNKLPEIHGHATKWAATQAMLQGARPVLPAGLPAFVSDLIISCWDASPDARPDAGSILAQLERAYPLALLHDLYSPQEAFVDAVLHVFDESGTAAWSALRHVIALQMPRITPADLAFVAQGLGNPSDNARVSQEQFRQFLSTNLAVDIDVLQVDAARLSGTRTSVVLKQRTISAWSTNDVVKWLASSADLAVYAPLFREHDIDGVALLQLSSEYLRSMGVAQLGPRKRLLRKIGELVAPRPVHTPPAIVRRPTNNYRPQLLNTAPPDPSLSAGLAALSLATPALPAPSSSSNMRAMPKGGSQLVRPVAATIAVPSAPATIQRNAISPRPMHAAISVRVLLSDKTVSSIAIDESTTAGTLATQLRGNSGLQGFALYESRNVIDERKLQDEELLAPLARAWVGNAPRLVWRDIAGSPPAVVKETVRIRLADGSARAVNVDSASRVRDVCSALAARLEKDEQIKAGEGASYKLWEKDSKGESRQLHPEDNVLLVKQAWSSGAPRPGQFVWHHSPPPSYI